MAGKWIEILKLLRPSITRTAVLVHPDTAPYFPLYWQAIEPAASALGVNPLSIPIRHVADIERAITGIENVSNTGLIVIPSAFMSVHRDQIIALAARQLLPAIYGWNYYARSGGLVSYGIDALDLFRRASLYIDRILRGSKPNELPVQQPTKFELLINFKTAKALGQDVPLQLQQIADEVIE
jgi:putative ABC transport system substrate-binding protein